MTSKNLKICFLVFASLFALAVFYYLVIYKRYNGGDYYVYVKAIERLDQGISPYQFESTQSYRYLPPTLIFYKALAIFPLFIQHWLIAIFSLLALFRMLWLGTYFAKKEFKKYNPILMLLGPTLLLHQGLSAQFESGNINLILVYLTMEGLWQYYQNKKYVAFVLMFFPSLFKFQFGLIGYFIFLSDYKKNIRPLFYAFLTIVFFSLNTFLFRGNTWLLYQDWWNSNHAVSSGILDRGIVAVNNSLLSFAHHIFKIPMPFIWSILLFIFSLLHIGLFKKTALQLYALSALFVYLFFPATFPYTLVLLYIPCLLALSMKTWQSFLFIFGILIFNPNFFGREKFETYIVLYRTSSWFLVPYFLQLLRSFF